ncbi:NAD(P)-dependent oxidoreductase [Paraburkholderia sp. Tr-20389]|uniref:NAD-dependent epimerase/dehydratase family protein n=1 Tax=Paraburkholderia sp. Tr-20389 TaxID=2703903 RepID=UPI0019803878|nr:NAD(P)-dependent oxidoreductase [Paraburkholderia sp. Tr-20389]MBN3751632.1 NAD(P)-dependent oxidoreductase [Paraburkholderia sp. Tr-20389]
MKTLVTGATSGLGRNAAAFLAAEGQAVRGTGRDLRAGDSLRAHGIEFIPADLTTADARELDRLFDGIDTVWHCAALSSPWGRYHDFHAANVIATRRLAEAAARHGVRRFVHISTPSLYFDYRHRTDIPETFRPVRYVNHYASTKAQAEESIRAIAAHHPATIFVVLRPRGIFGPHDRVLLPRILRIVRERHGRLPLPRGGVARFDLTYVENVVHAMQLATTRESLPSGEAFNITNGEPVVLRDLLEAMFAAVKVSCRIVGVPYAVLDAAARVMEAGATVSGREPALTRYSIGALHYDMTLDITQAHRVLGYRPIVSLADGIDSTVQWIQSRGHDYGL